MLIKIKFLKKALLNLGEIKSYKNQYSKNNGTNFVKTLRKDLQELKTYPKKGLFLEEFYFRLVFKNKYYIYCHFDNNLIQILRVVNVKVENSDKLQK